MNPPPKRPVKLLSVTGLIVGLSLIALLLTWGAVSRKRAAATAKTPEELFDEARATAIGKGTTARVVIIDK